MFDGDFVNYYNFVQLFMNFIEIEIVDSKMCLYYFVQYICGDVYDLMKSCLVMELEGGYIEVCCFFKERYG